MIFDFDIKDFHDHILSFGSIPFQTFLKKRKHKFYDEFIEAKPANETNFIVLPLSFFTKADMDYVCYVDENNAPL